MTSRPPGHKPPVAGQPGILQQPQALAGLMRQLDQTQWWPAERMQSWQMEQLRNLLRHARNTIPFYKRRMDEAGIDPRQELDMERWRRMPILTRAELQKLGDVMVSAKVPPEHHPLSKFQTSGSTGMPIKGVTTALTHLYWKAMTMREHAWQQRNLTGKLASIRAEGSDKMPAGGRIVPNWGSPAAEVYRTGECAMLSVQTDIRQQAEWLLQQKPDYLISYPSNLRVLAEHFLKSDLILPGLRQVRSYGETVSEELRALCEQAWKVPLIDMYTTTEVGYIALQCPGHAHYHVQSENVMVEVLDADGRPCAPGEVGRVVLTTLQNFAMPLIRYAIQDYAEVGPPCLCGRGLPVLNRVMGRQRNMLVLPDGSRTWPTFPAKAWAHIGSIRQMQLVQRSLEEIEVRLVADRALQAAEEHELAGMLCRRFGHDFRIVFTYLQEIPRGRNFKFEDFISEVAA